MKRNKYKAIAILMSAFLLASTSCAHKKQNSPMIEEAEEVSQPEISPLDSVIRHDFKSANEMAFLLFEQVDKQKGRENFMISPFSLTNALVMLANGADGNTLKQIKGVLGAKDMSIDKVCKMYRDLDVYLKSVDPETSFANSSSIWIDDKFHVKVDFIRKNKEIFNAEVYNKPLATEKTMNDINSWCDKQTKGHIKDILQNIPSQDSRMLLMNALYFKGAWAETFDKDSTKDDYFTNSDGSKSKVKMMHQTTDLRACVCKGVDMVMFPYGEEGDFYMEIILPHKGENLDTSMKNLRSEHVDKMESYASSYKVNISMPRMELRCETSLNSSLKALGMSDAFANNANFSKISDNDLYVSDIHQTTYIKVDEEGTEAAAETDEILKCKEIVVNQETLEFNMNRPFLYLIREKITGTILFMGKVRKL